jgi:hypothetical protein
MPQSAFYAVHWLLDGDKEGAQALLTHVPALGAVAQMELQQHGRYSVQTRAIAEWAMDRSAEVLAQLPGHVPDKPIPCDGEADNPREV